VSAPATPTGLAIDTVGSNAIILTWNNVAGETGFYIYYSTNGSDYIKEGEVAADVLTFWCDRLYAGTLYYFKVSAFNGDGESALSSAVSDTTLAKSMKQYWRGSVGPFLYDANALHKGEAISVTGARSEGKIRVEGAPTEDEDVARKTDVEPYLSPGGTENNLVDFDADGFPVGDSGLAVSDVSGAVDESHAQNADTDLDPTFEATFVKKTDTVNVLSDITSAGAEIEDAVSKKHSHTAQAHIIDADGTLADITAKFNTLLSDLETLGFLLSS